MVVGEKHDIAHSPLNELPFEQQGVVIVETPKSKHFYFITELTQTDVDTIEDAHNARGLLLDHSVNDALAERFYSGSFIPWGKPLVNHILLSEPTLRSRAELEVLELNIPLKIRACHLVTLELVRRVKKGQDVFGDWRPYSSSKLPRKDISYPPI